MDNCFSAKPELITSSSLVLSRPGIRSSCRVYTHPASVSYYCYRYAYYGRIDTVRMRSSGYTRVPSIMRLVFGSLTLSHFWRAKPRSVVSSGILIPIVRLVPGVRSHPAPHALRRRSGGAYFVEVRPLVHVSAPCVDCFLARRRDVFVWTKCADCSLARRRDCLAALTYSYCSDNSVARL